MRIDEKKLFLAYETDASQIKGRATDVILPESIAEVKQTVQLYEHICIRGGGSGLVGGAVPQEEAVLDLSKLDHIGELDKERKTIEVEAGVILADLQDFVKKASLEFPVKPSSYAICTIGGMIATNAVGSRAIKYGSTKDWVNWIEVVHSDGKLERKSQTEFSDYSGMEGITGVIVRASLKLIPLINRTANLITVNTLEEVKDFVLKSKQDPTVSMVEFMDKKISNLLGFGEYYTLIIEYESFEGSLEGEEYGLVLNKRDQIYPLLAQEGYSRIEDPKIILSKFEEFMDWFDRFKIPVFGHLSVGILHPCFKVDQIDLVPDLMKLVLKRGGKISGEHGIGLIKKEFLDPNDLKILSNVKKRIDKRSKFNRNKLL